MALLKNCKSDINTIKGKLATILGYLYEIESSKAHQMVDWYNKKSYYTYKLAVRDKFRKTPDDMKRGDIVLAELGMNIFPELSDEGTDMHYVLIWGQQGQNFIVIPFTSTPQPKTNKYGVNLGRIQGLPIATDSYAKIDAIRSISVRRIHRIKGQQHGKIIFKDIEALNRINMVFIKKFIY